MQPADIRKLRALHKRLTSKSAALKKKADKIYKVSGYSVDSGKGDEGWQEAYKLAGQASAFLEAASEVQLLIMAFESRKNDKTLRLIKS